VALARKLLVASVANCKNGISSYEMARDLGITQKSAWFMDHRIRLARHEHARERLIRRTAVVRTRMPGGVGGAAP
jgi:hypothetical protein